MNFTKIKNGSLISVRDIFVLGGLGLLGYGLYIFLPWVAFTVCGALLFLVGVFAPKRKA